MECSSSDTGLSIDEACAPRPLHPSKKGKSSFILISILNSDQRGRPAWSAGTPARFKKNRKPACTAGHRAGLPVRATVRRPARGEAPSAGGPPGSRESGVRRLGLGLRRRGRAALGLDPVVDHLAHADRRGIDGQADRSGIDRTLLVAVNGLEYGLVFVEGHAKLGGELLVGFIVRLEVLDVQPM